MFTSTTRRFARSRLGASLAAGAAAATVIHSASDERKRKSHCSAAAASRETAAGDEEFLLDKQQEVVQRGAGKRSHPARQVTNEVTGTAAQRAFFAKEMTVMGLPLRASEAVADSALVSHRPRYPRRPRHLRRPRHPRSPRMRQSFPRRPRSPHTHTLLSAPPST